MAGDKKVTVSQVIRLPQTELYRHLNERNIKVPDDALEIEARAMLARAIHGGKAALCPGCSFAVAPANPTVVAPGCSAVVAPAAVAPGCSTVVASGCASAVALAAVAGKQSDSKKSPDEEGGVEMGGRGGRRWLPRPVSGA